MEAVLKLLRERGWAEDGATQSVSYKTASAAYGGGSVVQLDGRTRLQKGQWKVTVGKRTTCFYRRPANPEYVIGTGKSNLGRKVYTFRDWEQVNIPTKDLVQIVSFLEGRTRGDALRRRKCGPRSS